MRKSSALCILLSLLGASVVMAPAPAVANEDCTLEAPGSSTVYLEDGTIQVNPNGPSQDLAALRAWATDNVNCVLGAPVLDPVKCVAGLGVGGPYVYQDPNTGNLVVAYEALISHAGAVAGCLTN